MRLLKFLSEVFDYTNPSFKVSLTTSSVLLCDFKVDNFSTHKVVHFTARYSLDPNDGSALHFGFSRNSTHDMEPFRATGDWAAYSGKVFSGVIQGLPLALKHFSNVTKLVGIALNPVDDKGVKHGDLAKVYRMSSFKKAVEKAAPSFKFSKEEKLSNGNTVWVYTKQ